MILKEDFYLHHDVLYLAKKLLGKYLFTLIEGELTGGIIVETEAYRAPEDKASHAYNWLKTKRNESMYLQGGSAYVYLCYGIHTMFNVVTNKEKIPHAILIRALEPTDGKEIMLRRRNKSKLDYTLTSGPGSLTKALGITLSLNGASLQKPPVWIEDRSIKIGAHDIISSKRVGIDYAEEFAHLPWRFRIKNCKWCSKAP